MPSPRAAELAAAADLRLQSLLRRTDAAPGAALAGRWSDRRVADVLAHLYAWHVIFDGWVAQDRAGSVPAFPAEGYTWATLDDLNDTLYTTHRDRSYEALRAMLVASHHDMLTLIQTFSQEELTERGHFPWLGDQSLGDVAHECLGAHYEWAHALLDESGIA